MRYSSLLFIQLLPTIAATQIQIPEPLTCDKNRAKISFSGKAPSPWAIDGSAKDWRTILGPLQPNNMQPYTPPAESGFNWAMDDGLYGEGAQDLPAADQDLIFLSFIHDDYNVYFYFRRLDNGSANNTFYFFCDINADNIMEKGEPVFHGTFSNAGVSDFSVSAFIPNVKTSDYIAGYGNLIISDTSYYEFNRPFMDENGFLHYLVGGVSGYPQNGSLQRLFSTRSIPRPHKLKKAEQFSAAITENGYGVELSIPWSYFKNWLPHHSAFKKLRKPLQPGEVFFYKLSIMNGAGPYEPAHVADNVGNCCGGLGKTANVLFDNRPPDVTSLPSLSNQTTFRLKKRYVNETNAREIFSLDIIEVSGSLQNSSGSKSAYPIYGYPDRNCNGKVDPDEEKIGYKDDGYPWLNDDYSELGPSVTVNAPPYGEACMIVDITFTGSSVIESFVTLNTASLFFTAWEGCCDGCGGKVINPAGVSTTKLSTTTSRLVLDSTSMIQPSVRVFPNPTTGTINIRLDDFNETGEVVIQDMSGKTVYRTSINHQRIEARLNAGIYIIKVLFKNKEPYVGKIVVQ